MALDLESVSGGVVSPQGKAPALLPVGFFPGTIAQWSFVEAAPTLFTVDRSGNHFDGQPVNPIAVPDLVRGKVALCPTAPGSGNSGVPVPYHAPLAITGELTLCARVAVFGYNVKAGYQPIAICANGASNSGGSGNCVWGLYVGDSAAPGKIAWYSESGPTSVSQIREMATPTIQDGNWHFVCARRNAAGTVVDLTFDDQTQSFSGLVAPTGGSASHVALGADTALVVGQLLYGVLNDINVASVRASDAKVKSARAIMMGL